jgi:hypothetical protein
MKTWQIFLIGMFAVIAGFLLPAYERFIAGATAVVVIAIVVLGFLLRPRKEIFSVRTTLPVRKVDKVELERGQIAVRVELARLWLLFIPTFLAVGFLISTAAKGSTWNFSLFGNFGEDFPAGFYIWRVFLFFVVGILAAWLSERWILRDAEARQLRSISVKAGRVSYAFVDSSGGYYGGEGVITQKVRSLELASLVLYKMSRPEYNKIPLTCLFHRFIIVGHGLTDLDEAAAAKHSMEMTPVRTQS